jgi:hypothetical protein
LGGTRWDPVNSSDPFGLCPPWPDCIAQGIANWGAKRGGALGSVALNAGAALDAGFEALGVNDAARAGEAIGNRQYKAAAGFLLLTFGGEAFKEAKVLKNIGGGTATAEEALNAAEKWLGDGYKELDKGVYRSADGLRQFRMTTSDLTDATQGAHVHFEALDANGKVVENSHVKIHQQ